MTKICTGCGHDEKEPLRGGLACCSDSRYRDVKTITMLESEAYFIDKCSDYMNGISDCKTVKWKDYRVWLDEANEYYLEVTFEKKLIGEKYHLRDVICYLDPIATEPRLYFENLGHFIDFVNDFKRALKTPENGI